MMPRQTTCIPALLVGMLGVASSLEAQAPTRLEQVPVYTGASRQTDREAELMSPTEEPGVYGDRSLRESVIRAYRVAAPIEDVARFYQQRLAAREVRSDDDWETVYREDVPAGWVSPVLCQASEVDLSTADDPAELRAAYTAKRTPFRSGAWLNGMECRWTAHASETLRTEFNLLLEDTEAYEIVAPEYHHQTEIVIMARTWDLAGDVVMEERQEEAATPMPPPTEAQLEVPLYPGSRFDGTMSAQMSASDEEAWYYVFASTGSYEQVAAFYRERTGKEGMENEGGLLIAVRGEGLFPDLGVTIQPNVGTFAPPVQSVITVRKRR